MNKNKSVYAKLNTANWHGQSLIETAQNCRYENKKMWLSLIANESTIRITQFTGSPSTTSTSHACSHLSFDFINIK